MHVFFRTALATFLLTVPTIASADDGFAIGVRSEPIAAGIAVDYRRGDLEIATTWFLHDLENTRTTTDRFGVSESSYDYQTRGGSLGVFHVISEHGLARLSLGARLAYARERHAFDDGTAWTSTTHSLQIPLRLRLQIARQVAISFDLGVHASHHESESDIVDQDGRTVGSEVSESRSAGAFGSPTGSVGITYSF